VRQVSDPARSHDSLRRDLPLSWSFTAIPGFRDYGVFKKLQPPDAHLGFFGRWTVYSWSLPADQTAPKKPFTAPRQFALSRLRTSPTSPPPASLSRQKYPATIPGRRCRSFTMNDPQFQQHGGPHAAEHRPHGPAWKRIHHSPFFWIAAVFIGVAMIIYVTTNNLSIGPGTTSAQPVPALAP